VLFALGICSGRISVNPEVRDLWVNGLFADPFSATQKIRLKIFPINHSSRENLRRRWQSAKAATSETVREIQNMPECPRLWGRESNRKSCALYLRIRESVAFRDEFDPPFEKTWL
jgi:hypothetical protein